MEPYRERFRSDLRLVLWSLLVVESTTAIHNKLPNRIPSTGKRPINTSCYFCNTDRSVPIGGLERNEYGIVNGGQCPSFDKRVSGQGHFLTNGIAYDNKLHSSIGRMTIGTRRMIGMPRQRMVVSLVGWLGRIESYVQCQWETLDND